MDKKVFQIKKTQSYNKTIRMPDDLINRLQQLADENNISFNQLVIQCCDYALSNMMNPSDNKKLS